MRLIRIIESDGTGIVYTPVDNFDKVVIEVLQKTDDSEVKNKAIGNLDKLMSGEIVVVNNLVFEIMEKIVQDASVGGIKVSYVAQKKAHDKIIELFNRFIGI